MDTKVQTSILIVDDCPTNLKMLFSFLQESGFKVLVAESGESTIEKLKEVTPDLILLDVLMPRGMDGFETCRILKESPYTKDIPIIFMTVLNEPVDKVQGLSLGAVDYITKPFQQEEVLARIKVHLKLRDLTKTLAEQNTLLKQEITARKQAQAKLQQLNAELEQRVAQRTEELVKANRLKDEFLSTVSHELRTPLNAILGWAQLLSRKTFNPITSAKAIESIERNARSQVRIIDDILDVSQIIRGKIRLNISQVNLGSVISTVIADLHSTAEAKGVEIKPILDQSISLLGDSDRLQQIIWNLLSNAIKFTHTGGRVEVRLESLGRGDTETQGHPDTGRREEHQSSVTSHQSPVISYQSPVVGAGLVSNSNIQPINSKQNPPVQQSTIPIQNPKSKIQNCYAQIQVIDTGIGINPDFLPFVFERFRQADSTSTRAYGGMGLGLAIVRHLVELHGGTVHVDSQGKDLGATFTVKLPIQSKPKLSVLNIEPNLTLKSLDSTLSDLSGLQVVVVDDDTDTCELIAFTLEQYGAKVTAVNSAAEAIAAIFSSADNARATVKPDLLISDIAMPGEDGYSLIRQVRERKETLPAIALTAFAREEDSTLALNAGFQMHLTKPIAPEELVTVVANLAKQSINC